MNIKYREIPDSFCFNITNKCNLNCKYCLASANKNIENEPDLDEIINIMNQAEYICSKNEKKIKDVLIEGGEILLLPFINKLLKELDKFSFKIHFITNGTLVTKENALLFSKIRGHVGVSLDGVGFQKNNLRFRNIDTYNKVVTGIKTLVDSGVKTYINCTITKNNADDLEEITAFSDSLGVSGIVLQQLHCVGETSPIFFKKNHISYEQEIKINNLLIGLQKRYSNLNLMNSEVTFFSDIPTRYRKVCKDGINYKPMKLFRCAAGIDYFSIKSNLDVIPCGALPNLICGNLRLNTIEEIWNNSSGLLFLRKFAENRVDTIEECKSCKYNPTCDGGCRADMLNITGDWYAKHICCPHNN